MVEANHRLQAVQTPVLVAEYHRGEPESGHIAPHAVEVFALEIPYFPLIPTSIKLPGFSGTLVPVMSAVRSNAESEILVDTGVAHGPFLAAGFEQLPEPPAGYFDTGRSGIVGIDQHDLSGDEEHADFPDDFDDGEDRNDRTFPDPRFTTHVVFPRSFGHPTSDWRPKSS